MSKQLSEVSASPSAPGPKRLRAHPLPEGTGISRREAIPLIGFTIFTAGGCNFSDVLGVDPDGETERQRPSLAEAQIHRGGIQRYALQHLVDNVAVRVEQEGTERHPDRLKVTVYEIDPATERFTPGPEGLKVLEVHRDVSNATISQIESEYVLFYYLYGTGKPDMGKDQGDTTAP